MCCIYKQCGYYVPLPRVLLSTISVSTSPCTSWLFGVGQFGRGGNVGKLLSSIWIYWSVAIASYSWFVFTGELQHSSDATWNGSTGDQWLADWNDCKWKHSPLPLSIESRVWNARIEKITILFHSPVILYRVLLPSMWHDKYCETTPTMWGWIFQKYNTIGAM